MTVWPRRGRPSSAGAAQRRPSGCRRSARRHPSRRARHGGRTRGRFIALLVLTVGLLLPAGRADQPGPVLTQPVAATAVQQAAAPEPTAPRATVHRYRVWQWNVAGDTLHHGSVSDGLISAAVASIVRSGSQVATVNELCRQQFEALQAGLVAAGWPQNADDFAAFQPTVRGVSSVCQGQDFGNALFSIAMLGTVDRVTLPSDGSGEQRGLLCAALQDLPAMRFCTTHITPSGAPSVDGVPANVRQLEAVRHRLDRYHRAGDTVVIAGDFNAQPDYARLDDWYAPAVHGPANGHNTGAYRELDDTDGRNCPGYGEWTATGPPGAAPPCGNGGKIDMIFVREDAIAGSYRADALKIPTTCHGVPAKPSVYAAGSCSDHRILAGDVPLQVRTPAAATRRSAAGMR